MNTDRTFFSAFNDCGRGRTEAIVDPSMSRAELIENVRRGEFGFDNVTRIIAFNPVEHTCDDVTDEIFAAVETEIQRLRDLEDFPLSRFVQAAE